MCHELSDKTYQQLAEEYADSFFVDESDRRYFVPNEILMSTPQELSMSPELSMSLAMPELPF